MSKNGKLIFKTFDPYVTSSFGWRIHPITGKLSFHNGVDYGTNGKKLPQYAIENGIVLSVGTDSAGGKFVYVRYPRLNHVALHYHLDSYVVKKGDIVNKDTVVGYTGTTGQSTGIHLHFGWFNEKDWNAAFSARNWEDFEKYEYTPEPINPPTSKFKVGDTVRIMKTGNGSSMGDSNTAYGIGLTKKILKQYLDRPYPNQVGDSTGTIGFYKDEALQLVEVVPEIKKGDTVIVNGFGTAGSDGTGNKTKVYKDQKMKVIDIVNAKNAYGLNEKNKGVPGNRKDVSGWFNKNDIKL